MALSSTQKTLIGVGAAGVAGFAVWALFFRKKEEPVNTVQDFTPATPAPQYYDSFYVTPEKRAQLTKEQETPITSYPETGVPVYPGTPVLQAPPPPTPRPATAYSPAKPATVTTPVLRTSFIAPAPSAEKQPIPGAAPETYVAPPTSRSLVSPEGTSGPETPMPTTRLATPAPAVQISPTTVLKTPTIVNEAGVPVARSA